MDDEVCNTESTYDVIDAVATDYVTLLWTTTGDGTFTDSSVQNPTYTFGATDLAGGTVSFELTATSGGSCPPVTDTKIITVTPQAQVGAGIDAEICSGNNYTLSGASESNTASLLWSTNGTGTFDDATMLAASYTPSAADVLNGEVILTLVGYANGSCVNVSDEMILTLTSGVTVDAGMDDEVCNTESTYDLIDAVATDYVTLLWTTTGDGTFTDSSVQNPTYTFGATDLAGGTVSFELTATSGGSCPPVTDTKIITITPQAQVGAGIDAEICSGNNLHVSEPI